MALPPVEELKAQIEAGVPGASATVIPNGSPSAQHSLLLDHARWPSSCGTITNGGWTTAPW